MVLGIVRERVRQAGTGVGRDAAPSDHRAGDSWRAERGRVLLECQADIIGGFPGGASLGGRAEGAQLRITDRYLLVDEGRDHGFGLPIGWFCGARSLAQADRVDAALRLRYLDGSVTRGFVLRFRGSLLHPRGSRRAEQALAALLEAGLPESAIGAASADPGLSLDWDEAARYEQENVIWSGALTAPVGAGLDWGGCDIWLTTRSVLWGSGRGRGIHRAALERIRDVTAIDTSGRTATPALILGVEDASGDRHDLAFLFNRQIPERNVRERGACLVGLRSRGIPLGVPPATVQPWQPLPLALPDSLRSAVRAVEPQTPNFEGSPLSESGLDLPASNVWGVAIQPDLAVLATDPVIQEPVTDTDQIVDGEVPASALALPPDAPAEPEQRADQMPPALQEEPADEVGDGGARMPVAVPTVAEPVPGWPAAMAVEPTAGAMDVPPGWLEADAPPAPPDPSGSAGMDASSLPASVALDDAAADHPAMPEDLPEPAVTPGLEPVEIYEAVARRLLTEVVRAIDARVAGHDVAPLVADLPSETQRVAAFAQIDVMENDGNLSPLEADSHRARLVAVAEAGPRLRSLLELHDAGWVSEGALVQKRQAIMEQVSRHLGDPHLMN